MGDPEWKVGMRLGPQKGAMNKDPREEVRMDGHLGRVLQGTAGAKALGQEAWEL